MTPTEPFNIWTMNVDKYVLLNGIKEITSQMIFEPSTNVFHKEGLFSEEIFGQLGSSQRLIKLGYIELNTKILNPIIYKNTIDIKPIYNSIMQGKTSAKWNEDTKQFDICTKEDPDSDTGYEFFISHFNELEFTKTSSPTRNNKIITIMKAKENNTAIVTKLPVAPAGIRDIKEQRGRISVDEVNKYYNSILAMAQEVKNSFTNPFLAKFYDGIKYNLQLKVYEIYAYWQNFLDGKTGFTQKKYARRAIAYGTRNVVTSAEMTGTDPKDPTFLKNNEVLLPVFQTAKAFQPLVVYFIKTLFYNTIFTFGSTQIPVIDPLTKKIVYVEVNDSEVTKALSTELAEDLISLFQNTKMRLDPVTIKDKNDKEYWVYLIYDDDDSIYIFRNIDEFKNTYNEWSTGRKELMFNENKIRPLTYLEMMYISCYVATIDKYATITRYPAIEIGSIYPAKVIVGSTVPSKVVTWRNQYNNTPIYELPHYPILGNSYLDSSVFHPSQAQGLQADYDGDTISVNGIMSDEANKECEEYYTKSKSLVTLSNTFLKSAETNLTKLVLYNLTRIP